MSLDYLRVHPSIKDSVLMPKPSSCQRAEFFEEKIGFNSLSEDFLQMGSISGRPACSILVEAIGLEPTTSSLQSWRSPN
tara:strand:- start:175 stop:411 length:237 start_codon:yes stop_codon:yes gene_type:complete